MDGQRPGSRKPDAAGVLERKVRASRWALAFERAWPRVWLVLAVIGLFLLVSLLGLWPLLGPITHRIVLAGFALALLISLIVLLRLPWPSREDALRRLERFSDVRHRPASSYDDRLAIGHGRGSRELWAAHRRRLLAALERLRVAPPRPRVDLRDPVAGRAALLLSLVLALFLVGDEASDRIRAAFRLAPPPVALAHARLDAWVTPPIYTGKPPIMLANGMPASGADRIEGRDKTDELAKPVQVPEGSEVIIRASGAPAGSLTVVGTYAAEAMGGEAGEAATGKKRQARRRFTAKKGDDGPEAEPGEDFAEFRIKLDASMKLAIMLAEREIRSWRFDVEDDRPPTIKLTKPPSKGARGALNLSYEVEDDYGVVSAEARFVLLEGAGAGEDASAGEGADAAGSDNEAGRGASDNPVARERGRAHGGAPAPPPGGPESAPSLKPRGGSSARELARDPASRKRRDLLFDEPPRFALRLAKANAKHTTGSTYKDLTAHPWAGLKVRMTLAARDSAGQVGLSKPEVLVLPARRFTKPLARAVIEQRRNLYLAPHRRLRVARALNALTIAPERFIPDRTVYLALRSAYWRLKRQRSRAELRSVFDQLWDVALRIEDGDLSDAERALREAQDNLAKALEEGASEAEIRRLMNALRQALNRFLQSLAKQAERNGRELPEALKNNGRMLSARDLDEMLKNIESLARSGAREAAQQMLSQLRDMLERLQSGRMMSSERSNQAMQLLERFGSLIEGQQRLLDDTFRQRRTGQAGRGRAGEQRRGQRPGAGREGRGQRGLRGQRGRLSRGQDGRGLGGRGRGPLGEGEPGRNGQGLAARQGELRRQLERLMQDLKGLGNIPRSLDGAGRAMERAERALRGEALNRATQQQSLALDRLRKGAEAMAQQLMQGLEGQLGNAQTGRDPLGRPRNGLGSNPNARVGVPDEIDIQRARRILEELRRRLSEPTRPPIELDYLERLLKWF